MIQESEGWKTVKLGELFFERTEKNSENLMLLAITGTYGIIPRSQLDSKDNSSEDKSKYLKICAGDIGYNTMRMWQGVSACSDYEGIVSPAYTVLKPASSVDSKYFSYLFKMPEMISKFYRYSQGLVDDTRNLKYHNFKEICVFYPTDKKEQQKIAKILSVQDKIIQLKQNLIDEKKCKKKYLMQNLLTGKIRLKGFSGQWERVRLGEIGKLYSGLTYSSDDTVDSEGLIVLRSSNIKDNKIDLSDNIYVKCDVDDKNRVKQNDILICTNNGSSNLVGKCALITKEYSGLAFGAFMSVYRTEYSKFVFQFYKWSVL
ncbi:MAG: restriction endonuclease subunit S [Ruminococcus sp.]|nr:restriction endonuclease subunit S [Ruminococcus sp.]